LDAAGQVVHGFYVSTAGRARAILADAIPHRSSIPFAAVDLVDLGESGPRVSRVGLGCNNFGGRIGATETRTVVEAALEAGVSFFDTAESYGHDGGSERLLGEILEGRREHVVLATKFGWRSEAGHGSREYIRGAIAGSLERLRTSYVDLYYVHRPDLETPIGVTLDALHELVEAGTVRAIGCSNFAAARLAEADEVARERGTTRFTVLQNHYNLLRRGDDEDILPLCRELAVSYIPYFPLASGLLTGKYRRGKPAPEGTRLAGRQIDDEQFDRIEALARFAEERGHTLLELAIAALASTPGIGSVIAGATKPDQVRANAAAASWHIGPEELAALADV
jgi:aryl-alcohol dehydrogenase-like predicted oxidoreductase